MLKKAKDPYLPLLAFRVTPLENKNSPAQLLMGWRLRTSAPQLPSMLLPELPDRENLASMEKERRQMDAAVFNKTCALTWREPTLTRHWSVDGWCRSWGDFYVTHAALRRPQGLVCRNRKRLIPLQDTASQPEGSEGSERYYSPPQQAPPTLHWPVESATRTRSGREIIKPQGRDLQSWKKSLILTSKKYLNAGSFKYWVTLSWVLCNLKCWICWIWSLKLSFVLP